jgi:hypothetical protein
MPEADVFELRPEASIDATWRPKSRLRLKFEGRLTGLDADRDGHVSSGAAQVRDAWIEVAGRHADLRVGYGRIVWGRLDEVQPTDVINPLDAARFLLDGRSAARLGVAFVRGRIVASDRFAIEGVLVPVFERGTYDALDEDTSPFNLAKDVVTPPGVTLSDDIVHVEHSAGALSGGGRMTATIGRVDVAAAVYRGFEAFGPVTVEIAPSGSPAPPLAAELVDHHARFTMIGGDFETATGDWAWRGEVAMFTERQLPNATATGLVDGHVLESGIGFDRPLSGSRVYGSLLVRREWSDQDRAIDRTDVDLVGSIEHHFGRDRYVARAFVVVNPGDAAAFLRGLFAWSVSDNLWIEASGGLFAGTGDDTLSRFSGRDFLFARVRYHF